MIMMISIVRAEIITQRNGMIDGAYDSIDIERTYIDSLCSDIPAIPKSCLRWYHRYYMLIKSVYGVLFLLRPRYTTLICNNL